MKENYKFVTFMSFMIGIMLGMQIWKHGTNGYSVEYKERSVNKMHIFTGFFPPTIEIKGGCYYLRSTKLGCDSITDIKITKMLKQ